MNFKKLILISLLIILAIGAVSAEDSLETVDLESTDNTFSNDINMEDYSISYSGVISNNASTTYEISDANYEDYFNASTGDFLANSTIIDGDTIILSNISNKTFNIDRTLNITSVPGEFISNSTISLYDGSSGTNLFALMFDNKVPNEILSIYSVDNINVFNCVFGFDLQAIVVTNSTNVNIKKNEFICTLNGTGDVIAIDVFESENVLIDENIFDIETINSTSTKAITAGKVNDLTISNNKLYVYGEGLTNTIVISKSEDVIIESNDIITIGSEKDVGYDGIGQIENYYALSIHVYRSDKVSISKNNITLLTNDLTPDFWGTIQNIYIESSNNTIIDSNNILTNGSIYVYGLSIGGFWDLATSDYYYSLNNTVSNNYFYSVSEYYANCLSLSSYAEYTNVENNFLVAESDNFTYSVYLQSSYIGPTGNHTIANNIIIANSSDAVGISDYGSKNTSFYDNSVYVTGNLTKGIEILTGSWNNNYTGNTIFSYGLNENSTGIVLGSGFVRFNNVSENTIRTNGNYSVIFVENNEVRNNSVTYNNLYADELYGDLSVKNNSVVSNIIQNNYLSLETYLDLDNLTHYYNDSGKIAAILKDEFNNPLINQTIVLQINGTNITAITDGEGIAYFDAVFAIGIYNVTFVYNGNLTENLAPVSTEGTITILSKEAILSGDDIEMYYNNGTQYIVVLTNAMGNPLVNETVVLYINGKYYNRTTDVNGTVYLDITLDPGLYNITAFFNKTADYESTTINNAVEVLTTVLSEDVTKYYRNDTQYYVTVYDGQGNPLANTTINITINNQTYPRTTDENGTIRFSINLIPGNYTLTVINPNDNLTVVNNIIVLPTTEGNDIVKYFRNGTQYYVTVYNGQGNPIANRNVTMNINGVFYNRTTNENGTVMLSINLNPGNYTITTTNPNDNGTFSNNIEVLATISGEDIVKYFRNGTQYYATLLNATGAPLANRTVSMNINGVFYNRTTDENGTVMLSINLNPGNYTITVTHPVDGYVFSNNIEVLPTLTGSDLNKTFGGSEAYETKVVDGQGNPLANQTVTINIHGVFYNRTTDSNGIAKLNINLDPGSYIATAYWNNYATSNKIEVKG